MDQYNRTQSYSVEIANILKKFDFLNYHNYICKGFNSDIREPSISYFRKSPHQELQIMWDFYNADDILIESLSEEEFCWGKYHFLSITIYRNLVFMKQHLMISKLFKYVDKKYEILNYPNDLSLIQIIDLNVEFTKKYMIPVIEGKISFRNFYSQYGINPKDLK